MLAKQARGCGSRTASSSAAGPRAPALLLVPAQPQPAHLPSSSRGHLHNFQQQQQQQQHRCPGSAARTAVVARAGIPELVFAEGYKEVEEVRGVRLVVEGETPRVDYLIKWKDGAEETWEVAKDLSEDLVRDYEEKWWSACRKADIDQMIKMLAGGRDVLAHVVDEDKRSALHFAAALGHEDCTKLLIEAGADINLQDKEGYTPLHMAAGYMHTSSMTALLAAGANPEMKDNKGRDVVGLVDNLRLTMPLSMGTVQRRLALEEVANCLTDRLYDEVAPTNIITSRKAGDDGTREFLVQFPDGRDDEWLPERNISKELLEEFDAGLEFATAEAVLDVVQVRTERRFKVKWSDGYPTSWEPEENVSPELIALFRQQNPQLFEERTNVEATADKEWTAEYETQYSVSKATQAKQQQQEQQHAASAGASNNGKEALVGV